MMHLPDCVLFIRQCNCNFITFVKACGIIHLAGEGEYICCYIAFKWPEIHYRLSASLPVMTTPPTVASQLVFVATDTFLSLEGCNTFQAKMGQSEFLAAGMVHNSSSLQCLDINIYMPQCRTEVPLLTF